MIYRLEHSKWQLKQKIYMASVLAFKEMNCLWS